MRVLVCGGRSYRDREAVFAALDLSDSKTRITHIIEGGARGADYYAAEWARTRAIMVSLESYPADWNAHGKAAGPIRNKQMLEEGQPDLVIAFQGGRGTANMIAQARQAGIPVEIVEGEPSC